MSDSREQSELGAVRVKPNLSTSSNHSNYSGDTFESISSNESGSGGEYSSEAFESYSVEESESSVHSVSQREDPETDTEDEQTQSVEAAFHEEETLGKWIAILQGKRTFYKSTEVNTSLVPQQASDDEVKAQQSFCVDKIRQMLKSSKYQLQKVRNDKKLQAGVKSTIFVTPDENASVPMAVFNRIYLDNMRETTKHIKRIRFHDPSKCPACSAKQAELATMDFIRRKKTAMEEVLLQEKLEDQLYLKDSITLIGEIHKTLPKLSEDPQLIWQRLFSTAKTL